jgi:putative acetyltransferase
MLTIRQARTADCEALCGIYRAAIVHHYSRVHGDEAKNWAKLVQPDAYRSATENGSMIIVEEMGHPLGYANFNLETGDIEISVLPEAEKRYIASALLAVIETEARTRGLESLRVNALVDSERMYTACGFDVVGAMEVPLSGTVTIPCIAMQKRLVYTNQRPERRRNGKAVEVDRTAAPDA